MRRMLSILLLLSFACATQQSQRPAGMPQPDVDARLLTPIFFGSGTVAPANIEVQVVNRGKEPITVRRVELDSPGMGQYTLLRISRQYNDVIAPGETKSLTIFGRVAAQTTTQPTEPLTVRAFIELQSQGHVWRELALIRMDI